MGHFPRTRRIEKFAASQHSLCSASLASSCYAFQQGMGESVVSITRGGEWDSFRPNALNVQRAAQSCLKLTAAELWKAAFVAPKDEMPT